MDKAYHAKVIADTIGKLQELDIDLYLILTSEGADPITSFIPGVDTVGSGAYLFTKDGKKIGVASSIDAQDVEESGLLDEVLRYDNYDSTVAKLVKDIAPKRVALNYSLTVPFCDGLTLGRYNSFVASMGGSLPFETVSADTFIPALQAANPAK